MDGVIVDNREFHFLAWKEFARDHGLSFDMLHFKDNLFGRVNRDILRGLFGKELLGEQAMAYAVEKEALYRKLYSGRVKAAAGLVGFLRALKDRGVATAVATSAPRVNLDFVLDEADLRRWFDALIDIACVAKGKPAPDIYLKAAEALGREPVRCAAFEDSYPGIESALAAGMRVVGVSTTHAPHELRGAHLVIGDFEGLSVDRIAGLFPETDGRPPKSDKGEA